MACVFDDQPDVFLFRKADAGNNIVDAGDVDGIADIVPKFARLRRRRERVA